MNSLWVWNQHILSFVHRRSRFARYRGIRCVGALMGAYVDKNYVTIFIIDIISNNTVYGKNIREEMHSLLYNPCENLDFGLYLLTRLIYNFQ